MGGLQENHPVQEQQAGLPRNKKINVKGYGIPTVDFFWLSDVLLQLIRQADCATIKRLDSNYLADLGFIQRELFRFLSSPGDGGESAGSVPDVRIIQAFVRLMEVMGQSYQVEMVLPAAKEMDEKSIMALEYLESRKVGGVVIHRPKES